MGCGCEERRTWLLNNTPEKFHDAISSFDGYDFLWNVLAGVGTVVVLYLLLRSRKSIDIG